MHTFAENNVRFSFQSSTIVNVLLGKTGLLSTHVIRELGVYSKVQNGHYAGAYIISIESSNDADENLWRVCSKAQRFAPDVLVAVVYPHNSLQVNLQNSISNLKPAGRIQVFATHKAALSWIENKHDNHNGVNLSDSFELVTELVA